MRRSTRFAVERTPPMGAGEHWRSVSLLKSFPIEIHGKGTPPFLGAPQTNPPPKKETVKGHYWGIKLASLCAGPRVPSVSSTMAALCCLRLRRCRGDFASSLEGGGPSVGVRWVPLGSVDFRWFPVVVHI